MATQLTPYIPRNPGDLITAEDWDDMQIQIKEDIANQIESAKDDVLHGTTPVDHAVNADKFDNKTPKNWTDELDQRYAPKVHDHEGMANYQRYFRQMDEDKNNLVILEHGLGRFPLVDIYQLWPITVPDTIEATNAVNPSKFVLYYGHEELDILKKSYENLKLPRRKSVWGIPWEQLLTEYEVKYEDDDSLNDVINDFLDTFFTLPLADEVDHQVTKWIDEHRDKFSIEQLKKRDEWDDIRWGFLPRKLNIGGVPLLDIPLDDETEILLSPNPVDIFHLNYNSILISFNPSSIQGTQQKPSTIDLMIVLRS